jgi:methionyl-tRNA synthetase (EC 6.1.1.10)
MDYITIDEFLKVKLVVGKVIDVQDHPNADKLYILKVDLGNEVRQIVSGINNGIKGDY